MISPADRASIVASARAAIERGSKSFVLASRLFNRCTRERAWLLYSWCRACDDAVDGQALGQRLQGARPSSTGFEEIRRKTELALAGVPVGEVPFDALGIVADECGITPAIAHAHLKGFELDAFGWRPVSEDDLLRYCYHVAGTVGHMMALVMEVTAEQQDVLDRATDLGIAFQLANIARDIAEDEQAGRCYLPQVWLAECGLHEGGLLAPGNRHAIVELRRRLGALSLRYERSARVGAARLPFRSRWAVLAAANIYGRIARQAERADAEDIEHRLITSRFQKLAGVVRALFQALRSVPPISRSGLWTAPPMEQKI